MADKSIGELIAASAVNPSDLFVLQQNNTAKKLTGQILENWLLTLADGHGGIQTITKTGTSGFVDTYTITFADTTTSTFTVTNGRSISNVTTYYAVSSSGSTAPTTWYTTRQSMTSTNRYLWSYTNYAFNGGSPANYTTPPCVIGVWGDKGDTGDTGTSVVAIVAQSVPVGAAYKDYKFQYSDGTYTNVIRIYDGRGISSIEKTATSADGLTDTYTITYTYGTPATSTFTVTNAKSIVSITKTGTVGLQDTYTIAYNDNTTSTFVVTNGKSITGISKTGTSGLVDTYSITWNDGSNPTTFTVTNGSSISSIAKTGTVGLIDTYTVTMTDGTTSTFTVTNAKSIVSVEQISGTHAAGTTDVYRITFNDGDTADFSVYNGANGSGAVSTVDGIQPGGNQNVTLLLTGNGAPTTSTVGQLYQRYFDLNSQILYICTGVDTSTTPNTYTWAGTGVPVDSSLSSSSENPVQNKVITGKVGTATLTTTAQDLSGAVNELDSDMNGKVSKSGDTMTGTLLVGINTNNGAGLNIRSDGLTDGTTVGATNWGTNLQFSESTPTNIGSLYPVFRTDGKQGMAMRSRRTISGSYNDNYLEIGKDASGKSYVMLESPKAWKEALGVVNPNLLDNWYFVKGSGTTGSYGVFPVNQRGQSSYPSVGHGIDRWRTVSSNLTVTVGDSGISLTNSSSTSRMQFLQLISNYRYLFGKTVTGTLLLTNNSLYTGTITLPSSPPSSASYPEFFRIGDSILRLVLSSSGAIECDIVTGFSTTLSVAAVKVEIGDTQTLAHLEGSTWVLNELPNYDEELRKCQAYFVRFKNSASAYAIFTTMLATSTSNARGIMPIPVPMVKSPTISLSGSLQLGNASLNSGYAITSLSVQSLTNTSLLLGANVSSGLTAGQFFFLRNGNDTNAYIDLSAES